MFETHSIENLRPRLYVTQGCFAERMGGRKKREKKNEKREVKKYDRVIEREKKYMSKIVNFNENE